VLKQQASGLKKLIQPGRLEEAAERSSPIEKARADDPLKAV